MPQKNITDIYQLLAEQSELITTQNDLMRQILERLDRGDCHFDKIDERLDGLERMLRESEQRARIYQTVASETKSRLEYYRELSTELKQEIGRLEDREVNQP